MARLGISALCYCLLVGTVSGIASNGISAFAPPLQTATGGCRGGAPVGTARSRSSRGAIIVGGNNHYPLFMADTLINPGVEADKKRKGVELGATTIQTEEALTTVAASSSSSSTVQSSSSSGAAPTTPTQELEIVKMDPFRPSKASVDPAVINILVKILGSNEDAERVANKAIRKRMRKEETALSVEDRRLIYKRVYGVEVLRGRLLHLLEHAVKNSPLINPRFGPTEADFGLPLNATGDPMLIVNRAESLLALYMMTVEGAPVEFLDSDRLEVLGSLGQGKEIEAIFDAIEDPVERIAARRSMPKWMVKRWIDQMGEEQADAMAAKINERPPTTLRVNTLKTGREAVIKELEKRGVNAIPTRYSPWGVTIEDKQDVRVFDQDIYRLGYVDLMNEASQCVTLSTGAKPYDIVLVYGAKKGSKAIAIASMLRGNGMIYLWEPYTRQINQISEAVKRGEARDLMEVLPNVNAAMRIKADVVLVDAICSNTGALSHHPSMRWAKNETKVVEELVSQQRIDLQSAARAVSPGGVLVYSTCSLLDIENQGVTDWFESEFGEEFEPLSFDQKATAGGNRRVLLPHIHGVDGTFIARWRRKLTSQ